MDDLYWHQILWPDQSLRQTVKALAKSMQIYWKSYAFLGGLENNESSRLPSAQLFQQIIVQHHFNHAPVRQTAARVVVSEYSYAQSLVDDLYDPHKPPHIAISVDMLDTGIDVPELVNSYDPCLHGVAPVTRVTPVTATSVIIPG
jgi:hypothetical protein